MLLNNFSGQQFDEEEKIIKNIKYEKCLIQGKNTQL